ncbi:RNA polymerase sigma factor [Streptomyces sp. 8N706]|uniref:RNA polymerase sigma factor n=1 Tax=Streptomyces sp. 8N706 TaxID=3457416 RepID=UPI003FD55DE5
MTEEDTRCCLGAAADFEEFVRSTRARYLVAAMMATDKNMHNAEDAVQSTYERLFKAWPRLAARQGSLVGYGRTTLDRAVIDQFRRTRRLEPYPPEELPEGTSNLGIPDASYVSVRDGIYEWITDELLPALPERQRQVVTLCFVKDLTPAEAAQELGLKEDTVKRYLNAALNRLQKTVYESSEEVTA